MHNDNESFDYAPPPNVSDGPQKVYLEHWLIALVLIGSFVLAGVALYSSR